MLILKGLGLDKGSLCNFNMIYVSGVFLSSKRS
jgi:hypothetical protein